MAKSKTSNKSGSNRHKEIGRSISPFSFHLRSEAEQKRFLRTNLLLHFRPFLVKEKTLPFTLSWGLGGMAATMVLLQIATGILLKFVFVPTPIEAYGSVQALISQVPFGRLVRNIHHWSANFLVVVLTLHMLRVFLTGAFHPPRQFNWIIGLALFTLVMAANLSGYLLPYDQLAYWAVTVITSMVGYFPGVGGLIQQALGNGDGLGPQTLSFFFSMHTALIPCLLVVLMGFHFWRIRKAGGLVVPRKPEEPIDVTPSRVPMIPNLLVKEIATALGLTATLMLVSIYFNAELAAPANPGLSPNPVRAPWYFAGLQELLLHIHPVVAVSVAPLMAGFFLISIPYLPYPHSTEGIWFASARGGIQSATSTIAAITVSSILIMIDSLIIKTASWSAGISPFIRDGILPLLLVIILVLVWVWVMRKRWRATKNEITQALFIMSITVLVVLTVVCVFFRGASMKLIWPFI